MGFGSIKNVGIAVVESIVKERKKNGEFRSFTDFCERMSNDAVNKRCIESLIKAGAFDEFGDTRATLLASFERILDTINNSNKKSYQGQVTMFDLGGQDENLNEIKYNFTVLPELGEKELLSMEKEMLGIYITGHPLDKIREKIEKLTNINTLKMLEYREELENSGNSKMDGKQVKYAGIISSVKKKYTKRNTVMAFITVEDLYGSTEIIVFDSCYSKCSDLLLVDNIVLIDGRVSIKEDEDVKIVANNIMDFNNYAENIGNNISQNNNLNIDIIKQSKNMVINITNMDDNTKAKLRGAIRFFSGDKNNFLVKVKNGEQLLTCGGIYLNKEIFEQFKEIVGEENIIIN